MSKLTLMLSACALMWSSGALAGPTSQGHDEGSRQAAQQQSDDVGKQAQRRSFAGDVLGMRTFTMNDTGEDHAFAKLRMDQGGVAIVDLGPVRDLREQNMRLRPNQPVTIEGHPGRVNDRPVIVAYLVETSEQRTDLSRGQERAWQEREARRQDQQARRQDQRAAGQDQQFASQDQRRQRPDASDRQTAQRGAADGRRQETIAGQLVGYRTFDLRNERDPHVLGKVRTFDDELVVVDLGPARDLRRQQVELSRGMQVTGRGAGGRINDKPVIVLSLVELDGDRYQVGDQRRQRTGDRHTSQRMDRQRQQTSQHDGDQGRADQRSGQQDRQKTRAQPVNLIVMGQLSDARDVTLRGVPDDHRLVKVDSFHRGQVVVDLGTKENVQSLKLRKGDTVVISGQPARINNLPVLRAEQVAEIANITRTR